MKNTLRQLPVLFLILLAVCAISRAVTMPKAQDKGAPAQPKAARERSAGEVKFEQYCSRCHNAPQGFSPSITGTVVRHMRVRASVSEQDEQDLLKFLNP
jgi:hypothetical protein